MFIQGLIFQKPNHPEVAFQPIADLSNQRRHELAPLFEVSAPRVKYRPQFFDQEGAVPPLAKHRRHDPGQGHDPLEVIHVLRVDEDLEGSPQLMLSSLIENNVVDSNVKRMLREWCLDLISR